MKRVRGIALAATALIALLVAGLCGPTPVTVGAHGPPLTLDPVPVQQGDVVHLSGGGFLPFEPVVVRVVGDDPAAIDLAHGRANHWGRLDPIAVPLPEALRSGAHAVEAVGQVSRRRSGATLFVRANAPWMSLGSGDVKPLGRLGLIAGGFAPGEEVALMLDPKEEPAGDSPDPPREPVELGAVPTERSGNTAWTEMPIPKVPPGPYTLVARGLTSEIEASADVEVKPYAPQVELSPWAGPPGTRMEVNARGFAPGEPVRVYFGDDPTPRADAVSDEYGNLWGVATARVPYATPAGPLLVTLVGEESRTFVSLRFDVLQPNPWLELSIWWGPPGTPVGFSGGGWAAGERITFHVDSPERPIAAVGQADDAGWLRYAGPVAVPAQAYGEVTFVAVGTESQTLATATFKVVNPFSTAP